MYLWWDYFHKWYYWYIATELHSQFTKISSEVKVSTTPLFGVSFSIFQPRKCWRASSILTFGFVRPQYQAPFFVGHSKCLTKMHMAMHKAELLLGKEQGHQWKHTHHGPYWNEGQHFFWVGLCRVMQLISISEKVEEVVMLSQLSMLEWEEVVDILADAAKKVLNEIWGWVFLLLDCFSFLRGWVLLFLKIIMKLLGRCVKLTLYMHYAWFLVFQLNWKKMVKCHFSIAYRQLIQKLMSPCHSAQNASSVVLVTTRVVSSLQWLWWFTCFRVLFWFFLLLFLNDS